MRELNPQEVRVAFDADFRRNPNVIRPLIKLIESLREFDYQVVLEVWDERDGKTKGLDDLLIAGFSPEVITDPDAIDRILGESLSHASLLAGKNGPPPLPSRLIADVEPEDMAEPLALREAEQRMSNRMRAWFEDPAQGTLLMNVTTGAGKTEQAFRFIKWLEQNRQVQCVWYLCPTLELAEQLCHRYNKLQGGGCVIRGRTQIWEGRPMCERADIIPKVQGRVKSLTRAMCRCKKTSPEDVSLFLDPQRSDGNTEEEFDRRCEHFPHCGYFHQFATAQKRTVLFMPHEYAFLQTSSEAHLPRPNLVIVDESFIRPLLPPSKPFSVNTFLADAEEYAPVAQIIAEEMGAGRLPFPRLQEARYEAGDLKRIQGILDERARPPIEPGMRDAEIEKILYEYKSNKAALVFGRLGQEWPAAEARREVYSVRWDKEEIHVRYRKIPKIPKEAKILILDATADLLLVQAIFPDMEYIQIPVDQNLHVVQTFGFWTSKEKFKFKKYQENNQSDTPKTQQDKRVQNNYRHLNQFLRWVAKHHIKVGFIGMQCMEPHLEIPDNVITGHLGNIRGMDHFKECDALVAVGRMQPSPRKIENMARALLFDRNIAITPMEGENPVYPGAPRSYRLRSGRKCGVNVPFHPDPYCDA